MSFRGKIQYFLHGIAALAAAAMLHAVAPEGSEIYKQHCAQCHESGENRAPPIEAMQQLPASAIIDSLLNGKMTFIGKTLPPGHAAAVAAFLSVRAERTVSDSAGFCQESPSWNDPFSGPLWIGWGSDLDNSRFQPAELAGLSATDVPNLHLKWAFGFPDSDRARAAATVAGGRILRGRRAR